MAATAGLQQQPGATSTPERRPSTTTSPSSSAGSGPEAQIWFEDDDAQLLTQLLLNESDDVDGLKRKLSLVKAKVIEDTANDRWFCDLLQLSKSSGFKVEFDNGSKQSPAGIASKGLPISFKTPEGQAHISALVDLLGITKERAVKITLSALRSFALVNKSTGEDSDKENESEDDDSSLRSLLGTTDLFYRVLSNHRNQFLSRLRIITECLRLEQECRQQEDGQGGDNVGEACSNFLDGLDIGMTVNGAKRGIFKILVSLAAGPTIPGIGGSFEMPSSVARLRGSSGNTSTNEEALCTRTEAAEALMVYMYDRIDGGAKRLDLHLIVEAATLCPELEFGMTVARKTAHLEPQLPGRSPAMVASQSRLDSLWGLICAECMSLWRANSTEDVNWIGNHPFFSDISGHTAKSELDALCGCMHQLGQVASERRQYAFSRHQQYGSDGCADTELWGVHAPEAVAFLSMSLLMNLARTNRPEDEYFAKLGAWGQESARIANDQCGAFAYLHCTMENLVQDTLALTPMRNRGASEALVRDILRQGEIESTVALSTGMPYDENEADAASVLYASIGREILSATVRAFRDVLLSLKSDASVENISMLTDIASTIFNKSEILCGQFWREWEDFCQGDDSMGNDDEPMCYLLDASHSLAVVALGELNSGQFSPQAIIHYLRPLSSFLCLMSSLVATSDMAESVLTSQFLPDGLITSSMHIVSELAPLVASINRDRLTGPATAEERSTVNHASLLVKSVSTLAHVGGRKARNWVRSLLTSGPQLLTSIISHVMPRHQCVLSEECINLVASTLSLLEELLHDADADFQDEVMACFTTTSLDGSRNLDGIAMLFSGDTGVESSVTVSAMGIILTLADSVTRRAFVGTASSAVAQIELIGSGVRLALDLLATLISTNGEISVPASGYEMSSIHAALCAVVAALEGLKPLIYLHEDDEARKAALIVRNGIIEQLSKSTHIGQVIAFLATAPVSVALAQSNLSSDTARRVMQSVQKKKTSKWDQLIAPRRKSNAKSSQDLESTTQDFDEVSSPELDRVVAMALSLVLVWGEHAEDASSFFEVESQDDVLLSQSPCVLLLSKCTPTSIQGQTSTLNVANLNLVSQFITVEHAAGDISIKADIALLSSRIIKMCLRHTNVASRHSNDASFSLNAFRLALGGGGVHVVFNALLAALNKLTHPDSPDSSQRLNSMAILLLETISVSLASSGDLARSIIIGGGTSQDWSLVDKIVSIITDTDSLINKSRNGDVSDDILILRCMLANACLNVISELWKSNRLTCKGASDNTHSCVAITAYLAKDDRQTKTADIIAELTRTTLLAIMSFQGENSMQDGVSVPGLNKKVQLLEILAKTLTIMQTEAISRLQPKGSGLESIKFMEDLFDLDGPLECWKVVLSSSNTSTVAAATWMDGFTESVGRRNTNNWNVISFAQACQSEKDSSFSSWCAIGPARRVIEALSSTLPSTSAMSPFAECNSLYALDRAESTFAASWASMVDVLSSKTTSSRPKDEVVAFLDAVGEISLTSLCTDTESKAIAQSMMSSQGLVSYLEHTSTAHMCALFLHATTARRGLSTDGTRPAHIASIERLYKSASRYFNSFSGSAEDASIRTNFLASAIVLLSEVQSCSSDWSREEVSRFNNLRIGFADLSLSILACTQYEESDNFTGEGPGQSKYMYSFSTEGSKGESLKLLKTALALLSRLVPQANSSIGTPHQTYSYGVQFAACLKGRNALNSLEKHLLAGATCASMTYSSVYDGSAGQSVSAVHDCAAEVTLNITSAVQLLSDAGAFCADLLSLLLDSEIYRTLISSPLFKASCKAWTTSVDGTDGNSRHRGYITRHVAATDKSSKPSSSVDPVHEVWRTTIACFSALLRAARCQAQTYRNMNGDSTTNHFGAAKNVALDFLCGHKSELFSCFTQMNAPVGTGSLQTSIKSSSFSFTANVLREAAEISDLFSELCQKDTKTVFEQSGPFKDVIQTSLEAIQRMSLFLGAIGTARDLFSALERANSILDGSSGVIDTDSLLADGIPNARHDAIQNAHFAKSCVIVASASEFASSIKAGNMTPSSNDIEKTFQIHVTNEHMSVLEQLAARVQYNVLSVVSSTQHNHSFTTFSAEEVQASRFDVSSIVADGAVVAVDSRRGQVRSRYVAESAHVRFARAMSCDRSTHSISVEYSDNSETETIPWSWIVGIEDMSQRRSVFSYAPCPKLISDADSQTSKPTLAHIILLLRWCRHASPSSSSGSGGCPASLVKCVAELASLLLGSELLIYEDAASTDTVEAQRINSQLIDLFGYENAGEGEAKYPSKLPVGTEVMSCIQNGLRSRLKAAAIERDEERKLWEAQATGFESFLGGSTKRQGRRSPFRLTRKSSF